MEDKINLYLVSKPDVNYSEIDRFLRDENVSWRKTDNSKKTDNLVELSGRICYMSFGGRQSPKTNDEYIKNLIFQGHESVLEHSVWSFIATGVTRSFTHQLVRHRIGFSFSQLSQQYHNENKAKFLNPIGSGLDADLEEKINQYFLECKKLYVEILGGFGADKNKEQKRLAHSIARGVLPNSIETKIVFTANARSIRHLLKLRGAIEGDLEMRIFCSKLLKILKNETNSLFNDFHLTVLEDGFPIVRFIPSEGE